MALTARFGADFSDFNSAVTKADLQLKGFESGAGKVQASLNRMANSLSGTKLIQDATIAAEAVERIGGASKLTSDELKKVNAQVDAAVAKMRAMGQSVPANMQALTTSTQKMTLSMNGASKAIGQVETVTRALGVAIPPEVDGFLNVAQSATSGATKLTGFAAAASVVGVAVASWKLGTMIGEVTGLTQKIADGTATLLGWGDRIKETAEYKEGVLARASKTAGYAITDLNEAMRVNQAEAERLIAKNKGVVEVFKQEADEAERAAAIQLRNREKIIKLGQEWAAQQGKIEAEIQAAEKKTADERVKSTNDYIDQQMKIVNSAKAKRDAEADAAVQANRSIKTTVDWLKEQQKAAEATARAMGSVVTYDLSTKAGMEHFQKLNPSAYVSHGLTTEYFKGGKTLEDAIREGLIDLYAGFRGKLPGFAGGVKNYGGGMAIVGERGPELVNLPGGSDVIPNAALTAGVGGVSCVNNFYGVLDQRMANLITDAVEQRLTTKLRFNRQIGRA